MSLRERASGVWQIRVYAGKLVNGKKEYEYRTFYGNKTEAKKEELRLKAAVGTLPRSAAEGKITFAEYAERWLSLYIEPTASTNTIVSYRQIFYKMATPINHLRLVDLKPEVMQRAFNSMVEAGYSPTTIAKARTVISSSLRRAFKSGYIRFNPAEDVVIPRKQVQHVRSLSADEVRRFIDAAGSVKQGTLFVTAILTGLRRAEICSLRWNHIDFEARLLHVREGGSKPGTTKTAAGQRDIVMPGLLVNLLLQEYQADALRRSREPGWNAGRLVFPSVSGGSLINTSLKKRLYKILDLAGISAPGYRFHDLRHTHGSLLVAAGIPITDVSDRLGHASLNTTVQTYLHSDKTGDSRISQCLDTFVKKAH